MTTPVRSKSVQSERAVVVGVLLHAPVDEHGPLDEIRGLAESAGKVIAFEIEKKIEKYWQEKIQEYKNMLTYNF